VGARCSVGALAGVIAGMVASLFLMWQAAILIGWDAASVCYLAWTWKIVGGLDAAETRRHANIEDASRRTAEVIVLSAGVALLAAVALVLIKAGQSHGGTKAYLITIGIVSVMLSWSTSTLSSCFGTPGPTIKAHTVQSTSTRRNHRGISTSPISPLRSE
jgi:uncharacterized membrane protein